MFDVAMLMFVVYIHLYQYHTYMIQDLYSY